MEYAIEINENYLTNEKEATSSYLERGEVSYIRQVARLEKAIIKKRIPFYLDGECFVIEKPFGKSVLRMYLWVEDGDYCFGPDSTILETTRLKEMILKVEQWLK